VKKEGRLYRNRNVSLSLPGMANRIKEKAVIYLCVTCFAVVLKHHLLLLLIIMIVKMNGMSLRVTVHYITQTSENPTLTHVFETWTKIFHDLF
jgi:hypothetical protein